MNNKHILLSLLLVYSVSTLCSDITLLQLDDAAIAQEKERISGDFKKRDYLAKASYILLAAGGLWFAYKWGVFDKMLGKQEEILPGIPKDRSSLSYAQLAAIVNELANREEKREAKDLEGKTHWVVEGVKYVGLTGFSMIAGIVVQSKWQKFFNYALATPTFDWFYSSHSMLNRIDSLRYHIANAFDATGMVPQASLDFHHDAIAPTLDTLYTNLKELIAFSEYYFDSLDADVVAEYNLEGAPRYLYNASNDFFTQLYAAIQAKDRAKALVATDAFRAELANYNKDCQAFENNFN